jgi:HSP20 family molecular chaperone IbpA
MVHLILIQVQNDNEKFAVKVNCSNFRPEELKVNVKGRELVIEGHHEEKSDGQGRIERHFVRKYALPKDANEHGEQFFRGS